MTEPRAAPVLHKPSHSLEEQPIQGNGHLFLGTYMMTNSWVDGSLGLE
jgi:hypothetical protein